MIAKLFFRSAPELEEVSAKPYLLDMRLMGTLCNNLFDGKPLLVLFMFGQPDQRKPSSPKQLEFLEAIRESVSKHFLFVSAQIPLVDFLKFNLELLQ